MAGAQFKQNHPKFVKPTHDSAVVKFELLKMNLVQA